MFCTYHYILYLYIFKINNIWFLYKLQAENRIIKSFPERIIHLNELLKKPELRIAKLDLKFTLDITVAKNENNINK